MAKNYVIENKLKIDRTSEGIEYSVYEFCNILKDGGIIEDTGLSDEETLKKVVEEICKTKSLTIKEIPYEIEETCNLVFQKGKKIPMTRKELAEVYWNGDREKIEKHGYPIERLAGYLCECCGHGRFVLIDKTKEEDIPNDKTPKLKKYIKCRICKNITTL